MVKYKMPFGKHKGELLSKLVIEDANYCRWLKDKMYYDWYKKEKEKDKASEEKFAKINWLYRFFDDNYDIIRDNLVDNSISSWSDGYGSDSVGMFSNPSGSNGYW